MQKKKVYVKIKDIKLNSDNSYKIKIDYDDGRKGVSHDFDYGAVGVNLKEAILLLRLNLGGVSFPEALSGIEGIYTYGTVESPRIGTREIPYLIDISAGVLTSVKKYNQTPTVDVVKINSTSFNYIADPTVNNIDSMCWLKGPIVAVKDGDTFTVEVKSVSDISFKVGNTPVTVGSTTVVRLIGVNTPESKTDKGGEESALQKNKNWLIDHSYAVNDENILKTYELAEEARDFILNSFADGSEVLVLIDKDPKDAYGGTDAYGRVLGVAYWNKNININKSLIANMSKTFPDETFAEPSYDVSKTGESTSIFDANSWWTYSPNLLKEQEKALADEKILADNLKSQKQSFMDDNGLNLDKSGFLVYNNGEGTSGSDYTSNANEIPADSAMEDYVTHPHDDRDELDGMLNITTAERKILYEAGFTRIGDCRLMIPPSNIHVTTMSSSRQSPTLRSNSSIQTQVGHSIKVIEMDIFFTGEDMINGEKSNSPCPGENPWYRNGLMPLIAQFKAAPFLPIENSLLNDSFGIYSVAFKDIRIETVQGFADTINAKLYLYEFDHTAYMPTEEYFSGTFNWRMFRWYYQRLMQPSNELKGRTYLEAADIKDQHIDFYIPDEFTLVERQKAIKELQYKIHPLVYKKSNTTAESSNGKTISDGTEYESATAQYALFQEWMRKYRQSEYSLMYRGGVFTPPKLEDFTSDEERRKYGIAYYELMRVLYRRGEQMMADQDSMYLYNVKKKNVPQDNPTGYTESYYQDIESIERLYFVPNNLNNMINTINSLVPSSGYINVVNAGIYPAATSVNGITSSDNPDAYIHSSPVALENSKGGGKYLIYLEGISNKMYSSRVEVDSVGKEYSIYDLTSQTDLANLKLISASKDAINQSFKKYEREFNELQFKAGMLENDVPVVPFEIKGIIVKHLAIQMSKYYASLQTQAQESPTLQYLGSQDTTMSLQIEALNKSAVRSFQDLMRTTQRYARDYRIAITSGILTVKNPLLSLFGVKDFLIKSIEVSTSDSNKETFNITIEMTVFDKTQRVKENLDSASLADTMDEDNALDAANSYFNAKKANENFDSGVMDIKLRNLEIYPDLQLPTYEEINTALPYLGVIDDNGNRFTQLPNKTHAKFVDPDFYIRAIDTKRDNILKTLDEDQPGIYTVDGHGFESIEMGPSSSMTEMPKPEVWFSDETKAWMEEYLDIVSVGTASPDSIDLMGTYNEFEKKIITDENIKSLGEYYFEEYKDYLFKAKNAKMKSANNDNFVYTDKIAKLKKNPMAMIDDEDMVKWYGLYENIGTREEYRAEVSKAKGNIRNPRPAEVHLLLYKLVKKYWPALMKDYYQEEEILNGNKYISTYLYGKDRISAPEITIEKILNVLKAVFHVESEWKQFLEGSDDQIPKIDMNTGNLGISGISINSGVFKSDEEIKRAAWDWQYNLEKGVIYFSWCYNKAIEDKNQDAKDNPLDWAVLFYCQGLRSKTANLSSIDSLSSDPYYKKFRVMFEGKYGTDASWFLTTPDAIVAKDLVKTDSNRELIIKIRDSLTKTVNYEQGRDPSKYTNWQAERDQIKKQVAPNTQLDEAFMGNATVLTLRSDDKIGYSSGGYMGTMIVFDEDGNQSYNTPKNAMGIRSQKDAANLAGNLKVIVLDPKRQLNTATQQQAFHEDKNKFKGVFKDYNIIEDAIHRYIWRRFAKNDSLYDPFDTSKRFVVIKETAYDEVARVYSTTGAKKDGWISGMDWSKVFTLMDIDSNEDVLEVGTEIRESSAASLILHRSSDIASLYKSGFDDLIEYDQRGRMLRAYPTFQIFLIDEGRWMTWHKLWDKFYGYNAVLSIDVMKDRRIVADTAIIELSNIYHNLTTHDNSVSYGEWEYKVTDLIFGTPEERSAAWKKAWDLPDEEIIRSHREELNTLILKPGARLHLRMGYGSNAFALPVIFNGTISEMNTGEIVTIVAQGDGVELTNKISADPDETTDGGWWTASKEPRQMICEMLTAKGGFFKNLINKASNGTFFNANPLGITHFGSPITPTTLLIPNLLERTADFGDAGMNIYCGAGLNTMSQWIHTEGSKRGESLGMDWGGIPWTNGDEPNVKIYLYDKTPWDVLQIYAGICSDYIATVVPFEFRSTLFFGKPWWGVVDKYTYQYRWDEATSVFVKEPINAKRKSLSQFRVYSSYEDIIKNDIKATDEFMYTNVIGTYTEGGQKTMMVQADSDIYTDKQRTAIVDIPVKGTITGNFGNQGKYAMCAATSSLRDYMKEMYQGELTVLGDPAVKPYDTFYLADTFSEMSGNAWVKRVVHHFSMETGFITNITPDCVSIIDDRQGISFQQWGAGALVGLTAKVAGASWATHLWKRSFGKVCSDTIRKFGKDGVDWLIQDLVIGGISDPLEKALAQDMVEKFVNPGAMKEAFDLLGTEGFRGAVLSDNISAVRTILETTDRKIWSKSLGLTDNVVSSISKSMKKFAIYIDEPAKIASKIDDWWEAAGSLAGKVDFFQKKGLIRSPLKFAAKTTSSAVKGTTKIVGTSSAKLVKGALNLVSTPLVVPIIAEIAFTVVSESVIETWGRYLKSRQAVLLMPLKYRGKEFTAGINGHKGLVMGDSPGKMDKFLEGSGMFGSAVTVVNAFLGVDVDYSTSEYDRQYIE